jgi:hypothetical protein
MNPSEKKHTGNVLRGQIRHRVGSLCFLLLCLIWIGLPSRAEAQPRRAILWLIDLADDATVERDFVAELFEDLLATASDADHLIDIRGLARYIEREGIPIPGCMAGFGTCENPAQAVADILRIDVIATIRVHGGGSRITLTVQGARAARPRILQFNGESLRDVVFQIVTDFVGASGQLTVTSRPGGALLTVNDELMGETPFQSEMPVGIYRVRVELEGYQTFEQTIELRPEQSRLIDIDLERLYAEIRVRTVTSGARLYIDGEAQSDPSAPVRVEPGLHTIRLESPGYTAEEQVLDLAAGSDQTLRINLRESPQAITHRRMQYVYNRPFYLRGGLAYAGFRTGLSEGSGALAGERFSVVCEGCELLEMTGGGFEAAVGFSGEYVEIGLLGISYSVTQAAPSLANESLLLVPTGEGSNRTGEVETINRFEVRPLWLGGRLLLDDLWGLFARGGLAWYRDSFDISTADAVGSFSRSGWAVEFGAGGRLHVNDTVFIELELGLGNDLSHEDSELATRFQLGLAVTWEDAIGLGDILGGPGPPEELDSGSGGY